MVGTRSYLGHLGNKGDEMHFVCPLWVISGHRVTSVPCPLFPSKRTFISAVCTSALCHAAIGGRTATVPSKKQQATRSVATIGAASSPEAAVGQLLIPAQLLVPQGGKPVS